MVDLFGHNASHFLKKHSKVKTSSKKSLTISNSSFLEGLFPVMNFSIANHIYNFFPRLDQVDSLQKICAETIINLFADRNSALIHTNVGLPNRLKDLLRGQFVFNLKSSAKIRWICQSEECRGREEWWYVFTAKGAKIGWNNVLTEINFVKLFCLTLC